MRATRAVCMSRIFRVSIPRPARKLAAVVHLLEVMVHDNEDPVTEEDRRRFLEGQAWFAKRGGKGIPMEDVLAEFGLKPEDFPLSK